MGPSELSGLVPYSALDYSGSVITGISGSALGGQGGGTDPSAMSAVASAYAESAASSKLDVSASSSFYPMSGNPSSFLTSHQSLAGYATESYVDSSLSGKQDATGMSSYATTEYVDSSLSGKLDTSAVGFNNDATYVTSISGVPLSASGGGGGDCWIVYDPSRSTIYNSGAENAWESNGNTLYGRGNTGGGGGVAIGSGNRAWLGGVSIGTGNSAHFNSVSIGESNYMYDGDAYGIAIGVENSGEEGAIAIGRWNSSDGGTVIGLSNVGNGILAGRFNSGVGILAGYHLTGSVYAVGRYNLHGDASTASGDSAAFTISDGTADSARHDLMLVTRDGEITMFSSTADSVGTGIMSALRAVSAAATGSYDTAKVAQWDSSYSTVSTYSADWQSAYSLVSGVTALLDSL